MMLHQYFYNKIIRKYITLFGNMFSDIYVVREDAENNTIQQILVPIAYGPREKWLARLRGDPTLNRPFENVLPRLAFEITNIAYDSTRALNRTNVDIYSGSTPKSVKAASVPVPYNFNITLSGMFSHQEDAVQVVEQIVPFFRPEWTITADMVQDIGIQRDIPIELGPITIEDTYEGEYETRRALIYTYNFTLRGYLFGPINTKGKLIRKTLVDLTPELTGGPHTRLLVTPGLLANGSPTSNSAASIPGNQISADSGYGVAVDKFEYFDGVDRHKHE